MPMFPFMCWNKKFGTAEINLPGFPQSIYHENFGVWKYQFCKNILYIWNTFEKWISYVKRKQKRNFFRLLHLYWDLISIKKIRVVRWSSMPHPLCFLREHLGWQHNFHHRRVKTLEWKSSRFCFFSLQLFVLHFSWLCIQPIWLPCFVDVLKQKRLNWHFLLCNFCLFVQNG